MYCKNEELKNHFPLINFIIKKNFNRYLGNIEYNDIFQEGCLALIKANITYDENKNIQWSTYASHCIYNAIQYYILKNTNIFSSRHFSELLYKIRTLLEENKNEKEICKELNISEKTYKMYEKHLNNSYMSIDQTIIKDDDNIKLSDVIEDVNSLDEFSLVEWKFILNDLEKIIKENFNNKYYLIFQEYFINGKKQNEIAIMFNTSQAQISKVIKKIKNKLKELKEEL